jgi:hypothetical protein
MPIQNIDASGVPFTGIKVDQRTAKQKREQRDALSVAVNSLPVARLIQDRSVSNQEESPFLRLPGELRNKIYGYALIEPTGLHYRFAKCGPPRLYTKALPSGTELGLGYLYEANQLKYACRQLYCDTKGYGLVFNDLTFTRTSLDHPLPTDQAIAFPQTVSKKKLK